jgi:putative toxin-antitoxin system antitoxin component (TIGR02293 family)
MSAIAKRLDSIQAKGGISGREVAQLLRTTPQTVSRWRQGHTSPLPDSLDRLLKLDWLADQLGSIYEPDEARLWLFKPHAEIDGQRPADLIASDRIDLVLDLIDRLQSGAYI